MPPSITLCTYTRDDARLVLDLLDSVASWTVKPDEIVVVDDGSRTPLDPALLPQGTRLLRNDIPLGPMRTKAGGIGAATGQVILSMDCDARIPANWLENVLPLALLPDVGIASSAWTYDAEPGLATAYLRHFESSETLTGDVAVLIGVAWLMRREVWEKTGGFSGFTQPTHEDLLYSGRVLRAGFALRKTDVVHASQIRRISHIALVRRQWVYLDGMYRCGLAACPLPERVDRMARSSMARIRRFLDSGEIDLCYVELLYLAYAHLCLIRDHAPPGLDAGLALAHQAGVLLARLARWPKFAEELRRDLELLVFTEAVPDGPDRCPRLREMVELLERQGALDWMEEHLPGILARERASEKDFSFYDA